MRILLLLLFFCHISLFSVAGRISGTIKDDKGVPLPFASVLVKGTTNGVTANSEGKYAIQLAPGNYILVCQYVGYTKEQKSVTVKNEDIILNFVLPAQELTLAEVVIKNGEDPAYEIIRQAIKKRSFYNSQVDSFTVDVYIKGLMRSRNLPDKFFGQTIDKNSMQKEGLDSSGKGILFLTESLTKVAYKKPDKYKYEVVSSKTDGTGGGFDFPTFINFYVNNVALSTNLNPRGFISPIADNALHFYRFKYEGSFFEGATMVNRIKVTPRRKNEPLFEGYIQITENEWRIHGLELMTTKDYQLELLDTLKVVQMHTAVTNDVWRAQNQILYVVFKNFGFDIAGNFVNIYSNYNLNPGFEKKHFGRILMQYDSAYNKRDSIYWSNIRPVPLEPDEKHNYFFKDSVRRSERDSFLRMNFDSSTRIKKPVKVQNFFTGGVRRYRYTGKKSFTYQFKPLLTNLEYNTVEGLVINADQTLNINPIKSKYNYLLSLNTRYGVSNEHFNAFADVTIKPKGQRFRNRYLSLAGGRRVSQFNNDNPIDPLTNSVYTLLYKKNYIKLYENWFGKIEYNNQFESGLKWKINTTYEERKPLENTTEYSFFKKDNSILPNHPYELASIPFQRHKALVASATLSFQPGQKYIQYPNHKEPIGSKYPTFEVQYSKGIKNILSSDVDFDKWKFSIYDKMNFKMGGEFRYRFSTGGFLNANSVAIPDLQHFNGNQTFYNFKYLNSFQLAPYYQYSNAENLYALAHVEHHFNGLFTNKIPLFNKLKWNLVVGSNTFYVNRNNYYAEVFAGLENIFKIFRVDFVTAYQTGAANNFGIRIGFGGILGGNFSASSDNNEVSVSF